MRRCRIKCSVRHTLRGPRWPHLQQGERSSSMPLRRISRDQAASRTDVSMRRCRIQIFSELVGCLMGILTWEHYRIVALVPNSLCIGVHGWLTMEALVLTVQSTTGSTSTSTCGRASSGSRNPGSPEGRKARPAPAARPARVLHTNPIMHMHAKPWQASNQQLL